MSPKSRTRAFPPRSTPGRIALAAAILTIALAASALAYWEGTGTGTATTVVGNPQALTFSAATPTASLFPGHSSAVAVEASNPNSYFVRVDSLVLDATNGAVISVDGAHPGCDPSVIHYIEQDNGGAGWSIPPKVGAVDGSRTLDLAGALTMDASAADACQGATFTIPVEGGS